MYSFDTSPFDDLMTDKITILKQSGERFEDIKAAVSSKGISIMNGKILVEIGDFAIRRMSNGGEETYEILDPGFHEKFHSIPAGYSMKVRKLGVPQAKAAIQNITYNFHGHNARVNQNSTDMSNNVVSNAVNVHLQNLRSEIAGMELTEENRKAAEEIIDTLSEQVSEKTPKKSIVKALLSALPQTANIAAICSLILDTIQG